MTWEGDLHVLNSSGGEKGGMASEHLDDTDGGMHRLAAVTACDGGWDWRYGEVSKYAA